jgi:hypothetical protein
MLVVLSALACFWRLRRHSRRSPGPRQPFDPESDEPVAGEKSLSGVHAEPQHTVTPFGVPQEQVPNGQAARASATSWSSAPRTPLSPLDAARSTPVEDIDPNALAGPSSTGSFALQDPPGGKAQVRQERALSKIERERAMVTSRPGSVDDAAPSDTVSRSSSPAGPSSPGGSGYEDSTNLRSQLSILRRRLDQVTQLVAERPEEPAGEMAHDVPPAYDASTSP